MTLQPLIIKMLERSGDSPLYLQIYEQIRAMILAGDLPTGAQLPPIRDLAAELKVSRITVSNAYQELYADGLVEGQVGRGTLVCGLPGDLSSQPMPWTEYFAAIGTPAPNPLLRDIVEMSTRPETIAMACGISDPSLYPVERFGMAVQLALAEGGFASLGISPVEGDLRFRQVLATLAEQEGIRAQPENVMVLTGSQMGIDLVARALLKPGDVVLSEEPAYLGAVGAFKGVGAQIIGVPLDREGIRLDILERALARNRAQLIYVQPSFHNPTGVVMSESRREGLLALARRYQVPILEDDAYRQLYYREKPPAPLKARDQHGVVIYLSTFSKVLFPGVRVGWMIGARPVLERVSLIKQSADIYTSLLMQSAMRQFISQGWLAEHIERVRRWYPRRRDAMLAALIEHFPEGLRWTQPEGGFYIWCHMAEGLRARDLLTEAYARGVAFTLGELCYPNGGGYNAFRLNFANRDEATIRQGVAIVGEAFQAVKARRKRLHPGGDGPAKPYLVI